MRSRRKPHDEDRPRVHPDVDASAAETRWTTPRPPAHGGDEVVITLDVSADAVRVRTGAGTEVWLSPGETAYVAKDEAERLVDERSATYVGKAPAAAATKRKRPARAAATGAKRKRKA